MPLACAGCGANFGRWLARCPFDGGAIGEFDRDPLIGRVIGDRYRVTERLASGAMGTVYAAEHIAMGRPLAVKVLLGDVAAQPDMIARFEREARALSRLCHRNVISVADFGCTEHGLPYLVEEFVDGHPLASELARGPLSIAAAIDVGKQVAHALAHAHARGVIHRDLKTDNLMLVAREDEPDAVKLVDFGIARLTSPGSTNDLTRAGLVIGTPGYMSPEQAQGDPADPRSDLYSLGVILYELVAGRLPFTGQRAVDILAQHVCAPPPPISRDVPEALGDLIFRLLEKDPAERPQSATQVVSELRRIVEVYGIAVLRRTARPWQPPPAAAVSSLVQTGVWGPGVEPTRLGGLARAALWPILIALAGAIALGLTIPT